MVSNYSDNCFADFSIVLSDLEVFFDLSSCDSIGSYTRSADYAFGLMTDAVLQIVRESEIAAQNVDAGLNLRGLIS